MEELLSKIKEYKLMPNEEKEKAQNILMQLEGLSVFRAQEVLNYCINALGNVKIR